MNDTASDHRPSKSSAIPLLVGGVALAGLLVFLASAANRAREEARQSTSRSNLKQLGVGVHNFHDTRGYVPFTSEPHHGRARHSWQTHLVPMMEASTLYEEIDHDLPWTAPSNRRHFATVLFWCINPGVDSPELNADGYALSHYSANAQLFPEAGAMSFRDIKGGVGYTLMCGEINANFPAWADPANKRDPARGLNTDPNGFGSPYSQGTQFTLCDGSVRTLSDDIDPVVLRQLADPESRPDGDDW